MARGNVLPFPTEKWRIINGKQHAHRRLVDSDRFQRFRIFEITDRIADLKSVNPDQRTDLSALDRIHLLLS